MKNNINYINEYIRLLETNYIDSTTLIKSIAKEEDHLIWYLCNDYAYKVLLKDKNWTWLAHRLPDFALLASQYIRACLPRWEWRAGFETGSLYKSLSSTYETIRWIMNRWIAVLKNLFDPRYRNHVPPSFLVSFDSSHMLGNI